MKLKYNIELDMNCEDERTLLPYDNEIMTRRVGEYFKDIVKKDGRIEHLKIEGIIEL